MLQDLILAAFRDAAAKVDAVLAEKLGGLGAGHEDPGDVLMNEYAPPLSRLIEELKRIPGVGGKSAQRMAFHLLAGNQEDADRLAEAIRDLKKNLLPCSVCNNITEADPCAYCTDPNRSDESLCVVEEPFHIATIEKSGVFRGRYHVLLGALAPLKGIGPGEPAAGKDRKAPEKRLFQGNHHRHQPDVRGGGDVPLPCEGPSGV